MPRAWRPRVPRAGRDEIEADVAIIGGSLGACAAALAATRMGKRVVLASRFDWIGGQLTSQAVPPDENAWIEEGGSTRELPSPARARARSTTATTTPSTRLRARRRT